MSPAEPKVVGNLSSFSNSHPQSIPYYSHGNQHGEPWIKLPLHGDNDKLPNETESTSQHQRSRACVACHKSKIRCLRLEGAKKCKACAKVNRECILPNPVRRRRRNNNKVAELEQRINDLTNALLAKQQGDPSSSEASPDVRANSAYSAPPRMDDRSNVGVAVHSPDPAARTHDIQPAAYDFAKLHTRNIDTVVSDGYVDVVDRQLVSMDAAIVLFNHWVQNMSTIGPSVLFPPDTQAEEIRRRRPMTFLSILAFSSAAIMPSVQVDLTAEISQEISTRAFFHGDNSIDLVHAMLLYAVYYVRPRAARGLVFHRHLQSVVVMCYELGIGKRYRGRKDLPTTEELELARTWLAVYHESIAFSTVIRMPALVRYDAHVQECLQILQTNPYALAGDKWLYHLVKLSRIAQEVSEAFDMSDPAAEVTFSDSRTQHQLRYFRRQLEEWEKNVDPNIDKQLVWYQLCCIKLYVHEIALNCECNGERSPTNPLNHAQHEHHGPELGDSIRIDALTTLLTSSQKLFDTYFSLDLSTLRSLPNIYFAWCVYAMVILIKIHWIVHGPRSRIGPILASNLRTDFYLDAAFNKLNEMTIGGYSPTAEAFAFIMKKLKIWHQHRASQNSDTSPAQDLETRRIRVAELLQSEPLFFAVTVENGDDPRPAAPHQGIFSHLPPAYQKYAMPTGFLGANLNAAFDTASYGNVNWDQFNFSKEEIELFGLNMDNNGWMTYLL